MVLGLNLLHFCVAFGRSSHPCVGSLQVPTVQRHVSLISYSKLAMGVTVSVNDCLPLFVSPARLKTSPGSTPPLTP